MSTLTLAAPETLTAEQLQPILDLYERGQCLQAYHQAQLLGPLKDWRGTAARVLAGRLAANLAAPRLAAWHYHHAFRAEPNHPDACWYHVRELLDRRGPLRAWQVLNAAANCRMLQRIRVATGWRCMRRAGSVAQLKAAERWHAAASRRKAPDVPWVRLERAGLLLAEDRPDEALAAAQDTLRLRPWYRPAVQMTAHLLVQFQRDSRGSGPPATSQPEN